MKNILKDQTKQTFLMVEIFWIITQIELGREQDLALIWAYVKTVWKVTHSLI